MAMLSGRRVCEEIASGKITFDPLDPANVNPNSVDVTLSDKLLVYDFEFDRAGVLDVRRDNPTVEIDLGGNSYHGVPYAEMGLVLMPGTLYLGSTREKIGSDHYVSVVEGKSSLGRLGLTVHLTAGFIDCGFHGHVTLEMSVIHPLRIWPSMRIGQVCFSEVVGDVDLYKGKYQGQAGVEASRSWQDFKSDPPAPRL